MSSVECTLHAERLRNGQILGNKNELAPILDAGDRKWSTFRSSSWWRYWHSAPPVRRSQNRLLSTYPLAQLMSSERFFICFFLFGSDVFNLILDRTSWGFDRWRCFDKYPDRNGKIFKKYRPCDFGWYNLPEVHLYWRQMKRNRDLARTSATASYLTPLSFVLDHGLFVRCCRACRLYERK